MTNEEMENTARIIHDSSMAFWSLALSTAKHFDLINHMYKPKVGDYVFETSNPLAPTKNTVGKLLEIGDEGEYKIERLDGTVCEWSNANFTRVPDEKTKKLIREIDS
jgi:hypothetical protein